MHIPQGLEFNTYGAQAADKRGPGYSGTSRINYFLAKDGSSVEAPSFTVYTGSYWETMSDHRLLLCWINGPTFIQPEPDGQKPRYPPCVVRKHGLKKEDTKTVDDYICELCKLNTADE